MKDKIEQVRSASTTLGLISAFAKLLGLGALVYYIIDFSLVRRLHPLDPKTFNQLSIIILIAGMVVPILVRAIIKSYKCYNKARNDSAGHSKRDIGSTVKGGIFTFLGCAIILAPTLIPAALSLSGSESALKALNVISVLLLIFLILHRTKVSIKLINESYWHDGCYDRRQIEDGILIPDAIHDPLFTLSSEERFATLMIDLYPDFLLPILKFTSCKEKLVSSSNLGTLGSN